MLEGVAILAGGVVFLFVIVCALSVGLNRLAKVGFAVILLASLAFVVADRLWWEGVQHLWSAGADQAGLARLERLLLCARGFFWATVSGLALLFVGCAITAWDRRAEVFPWARRAKGPTDEAPTRDPSDRA